MTAIIFFHYDYCMRVCFISFFNFVRISFDPSCEWGAKVLHHDWCVLRCVWACDCLEVLKNSWIVCEGYSSYWSLVPFIGSLSSHEETIMDGPFLQCTWSQVDPLFVNMAVTYFTLWKSTFTYFIIQMYFIQYRESSPSLEMRLSRCFPKKSASLDQISIFCAVAV